MPLAMIKAVRGESCAAPCRYVYSTAPRRPAGSGSALQVTPAASPETVALTLAGRF